MKNKRKKLVFFLVLFLSIGFFGFGCVGLAVSENIIINEIQIAGVSADDEFIELYNKSDEAINLSGFNLKKKISSGTESNLVSSSAFNGVIPAHGYFLISHPSYKNDIFADLAYSGSSFYVSANNTVILYDNHGSIADKVGFGTAKDYEKSPTTSPGELKSIERISFRDTDDNSTDFALQNNPTPRNSLYEYLESEPDPLPDELPVVETKCEGNDSDVKINEIYPNTENEDDEFVELVNNGEDCVDISGWKIKDDANHQTAFPENSVVEPGEYLYLQKKLYLNNDDDTVYLLEKNDLEVDQRDYAGAKRGKSYSFDGETWQWTSFATKGLENKFDPVEASPEPKVYPSQIRLNEILPNPSGKDDEYIEIKNDSAENIELTGWILRDATKTKKYILTKDDVFNEKGFLVIKKSKSKLSLNDSGSESVRLLDPNEKLVSEVTYSGAKDGLSYGFDGSKWRWSKHLTPGAENAFDDAPNFKVIKDDTVYKNFPANFDVNIKKYKKSKYKITWNFGDGHKSYKKTTTHKYDKNGKYYASVKIFNGSEEVIKEFKVEVKSFPKYDVEIIAVNPNPDGSDTDLETLTVRNNSKKKVNLQNWSIATGDKKLTNHPIASKITLKPKETLIITRALSKFTLNNKKAQVELRYPSGKVASKMKYDKKTETIGEGEILEKSKLGWAWKNTAPAVDVPQSPDVSQETSLLAVAPEIEQNLETPQILGESDIKADVPPVEHSVGERMIEGGQSVAKNKKDFKIVLASFVYAPFSSN